MSHYKKTIQTITEVKKIDTHMVALGRIRAASDDEQLNYLIVAVLDLLHFQHRFSTSKTTPVSLTVAMCRETLQLIEYCKFNIGTKKPEWQLIAEQKGWSPPRSVI